MIVLYEGHALGNGKTLALVIKLAKKRLFDKQLIAYNGNLKGIEYTNIDSYPVLHGLRNTVIGMDEIDLYCPESNPVSGREFYNTDIRFSRKRRNHFFWTTQQANTIQKKVRSMIKLIAFPVIMPFYPDERKFTYKKKEYQCYFPPSAVMQIEYFQYNDNAVMSGRYDALRRVSQEFHTNLYHYFQFFDTFEEIAAFKEMYDVKHPDYYKKEAIK